MPSSLLRFLAATRHVVSCGILLLAILSLVTSGSYAAKPNSNLRELLVQAGVYPLVAPVLDADKVVLGRLLFFDKELSGNRDIACATCHHPKHATGDGLVLPIGTKGVGLGPGRIRGTGRELVPRNSPEIFNRGLTQWSSMFWDSRVSLAVSGEFLSPAGATLPVGLDNVLSVQAMFPVTSATEMRGEAGDDDTHGNPNELANIESDDLPAIWAAIMVRLLAIEEYEELFLLAFPDVEIAELGFQHAANAIGAFEADAFTLLDSPWDEYVAGNDASLSPTAKRGAKLFYGQAHCASCHSGPLLTDQQHYSIGAPQLGPGKDASGLDIGRALVTKTSVDNFTFRTPPLRNVAVTGPWMHSGAYTDLEGAVRHHLQAVEGLLSYDTSQLPAEMQTEVHNDPITHAQVLSTIDMVNCRPLQLTDGEIADLLGFLGSLTSPSVGLLEFEVPALVPSGLPVD